MSRSIAGRTHGCGDLRAEQVGEHIRVSGWVSARRNHGGVHFVDLRDRYGTLQIVGDEDASSEARSALADLHPEDCIQVEGTLRMRIEGQRKKDKPTGDVELLVEKLDILSRSARVPFEVQDEIDVPEELRLKYR
ncbi:MAG: OB-fold nucleic acid binding domain-containing protein, partial [Planctomycetota bacterium]|nr:OB-fold nucleic acid binding domain-containing protein [Planctomycetota bacterium]